jgi:mono/diheme cytochrome c family protein
MARWRNIARRLNAARYALAVFALVGCQAQLPGEYAGSDDVTDIADAEARRQIQDLMRANFGTPAAPALAPEHPDVAQTAGVQTRRLAQGAKLYRLHCMHCHGLSGDGLGPTAPYLFPKPRDYRKGIFKFTSTERLNNAKPTRDDLRRILHLGVVGTAMPSFAVLPEDELEAMIDYVIHLSIRGEAEALLVSAVVDEDLSGDDLADRAAEDLDFIASSWRDAEEKVVEPAVPEPKLTESSIERGRQIFLNDKRVECWSCHGKTGRGDGPSVAKDPNTGLPMQDDWKNRIQPANLTLGLYRGGRRPLDLYRRVHAGIKGTPMPEFAGVFRENPEDLWHVVHFVQAMPYMQLAEPAEQSGASAEGGH